MGSMRNWMLGAAVLAGAAGLGSTPAHAVEFGIYVGGPIAYAPPCPGPGYVWVEGYRSGGYWYPGRWNFVGYGDRYYHRDYDGYYRGRDWDRDRHWDRDRDRDWGRDHDRDRGWDRERDHYRR
jgi:hypothetical protein